MNLLSFIPLLGLNIPPLLMTVGMKVLQAPGVFKDGSVDVNQALNQLPGLIKEDQQVTEAVIKVALKGLGVSPAAADHAIAYVFNSDGERTEEETEQFTKEFKFLNSPIGRVQLPYGCKKCNRIHYTYADIILSADQKPVCIRCHRELNL